MLASWFIEQLHRIFHRMPGKARPPVRRRFRPQVTCLEDRIVPSTFTEWEPNNTTAAANAILVPTGDVLTTAADDWLAISGTVGSSSDRDYFQFTLGSGAGVFFDLDSRDTKLSSTLDSLLTLFNADGTSVPGGSDDDGYDFEGFAVPTNSTGDATSLDSSLYVDLAAGTYLIRVSSVGGTTGAYRLRILADTSYTSTAPGLSSDAGAAHTLYLDFDGHSASDAWGTYVATPFDLNGKPGVFSPAERLAISNLWRIVSEDYSPFSINVTTVAPGSLVDGISFRHVITSSDSTMVGQPGGLLGVALPGSYLSSSITPAFTFANNGPAFTAGGLSGKIMARTVEQGNTTSHEFGHALGLEHFATSAGSAGPADVHPNALMAVPDLGLNRETWDVGMNEDGGFQDDMAIIGGRHNGIGYRADDHGDTRETATVLTGVGGVYTASGIIAPLSDTDVFRFTASSVTTITVDVDEYVNNLDAELWLYDATGALIETSDPANSFDATLTRTLTAGTYFIEVRSDGGAGEVGRFTARITTTAVNTAPVMVSPGNRSIDEGDTLSFAVLATDTESPQGLTYTLVPGAPQGATIDASTGIFSWTPTEAQDGTYQVTFSVSDGEYAATQSITVTVNEVNIAPGLAPRGNVSVNERELLSFQISGIDGDVVGGQPNALTYGASGLLVGASFDADTGIFSWMPTETQDGAYQVTFSLSDGQQSTSQTITITVNEINSPPELTSLSDVSVNEGAPLSFQVHGSDVDVVGGQPNALTYGVSGLPAGASFDASTGLFSWTLTETQDGTHPVTFSVSDGQQSTSQTITITVTEVNTPPTLALIGNVSVNEGQLLSFGVYSSDGDMVAGQANALTCTASGLPTGASFDHSTGTFRWTPTETQGGRYDITFTVTDGTDSATQTCTITVNEVPTGLALRPVGNQSVNEGDQLRLQLSAVNTAPATGRAPTLSYAARGLPTGANFNSRTGILRWTPTETQDGTYQVTFSVSDGKHTASETITITVTEVNSAPVLTPIGNKVVDARSQLRFTVTAGDRDAPTNTLTFSLGSNAPRGASIDPHTGVFTWTAPADEATVTVTIRVHDNGSPRLSDSETITIRITEDRDHRRSQRGRDHNPRRDHEHSRFGDRVDFIGSIARALADQFCRALDRLSLQSSNVGRPHGDREQGRDSHRSETRPNNTTSSRTDRDASNRSGRAHATCHLDTLTRGDLDRFFTFARF